MRRAGGSARSRGRQPAAAHRPRLVCAAPHQRLVHPERQPRRRRAVRRRPHRRQRAAQLQRAVQLRWVHRHAARPRRAAQPRRRAASCAAGRTVGGVVASSVCALERAVHGAVLEPRRVEAVVLRASAPRALAAASPRRDRARLPYQRRRRRRPRRAGAVRERAGRAGRRLAAAHLEGAAADVEDTLELVRARRAALAVERERQHEDHAAQPRAVVGRVGAGAARRARQLDVAGAGKDDAALDDVLGDETDERAGGGRAEGGGEVVGGLHVGSKHGMRRLRPLK